MPSNISSEFTAQSVLRINESAERINKCLAQLTAEEIWHRPNGNLTSIGNLVLHLCGNISQYVLSSIGGKPDQRARDEEFAAMGGYSEAELAELLQKTIGEAIDEIQQCTPAELLRIRMVQGFSMSGIGIIIHVTEHLSYHTGQIAFHTKLIRNADLGFYAGLDLNITG